MGVMVSRGLVVGNLDGLDEGLVFVPLLFLAREPVAIDEIAQIDHQGGFESVDFCDQVFEWLKALALEPGSGIAYDDEFEVAGKRREANQDRKRREDYAPTAT